jgi:hypothetical protein
LFTLQSIGFLLLLFACISNITGLKFRKAVTDMNEIRWTDKVYLDSQGNIRSSDGCPTDQISQDLINKIISNVGLAQDTKQ